MSNLINTTDLTKDQIQRRIDEIDFILDSESLEFDKKKYLIELKGVYGILLQVLKVLYLNK